LRIEAYIKGPQFSAGEDLAGGDIHSIGSPTNTVRSSTDPNDPKAVRGRVANDLVEAGGGLKHLRPIESGDSSDARGTTWRISDCEKRGPLPCPQFPQTILCHFDQLGRRFTRRMTRIEAGMREQSPIDLDRSEEPFSGQAVEDWRGNQHLHVLVP
jgi:hypothetical protein